MTDGPGYELFAFWRSSATYRVRVALNLKGISVRERYIDLDAGDQRGPDFLKINPLGAIPALVAPGQPPLTQSLAILEYLDETIPRPPLLPSDPLGRARVRSLAAGLAADTHPLIVPRVRRYLTTTGGFDDAAWRAWQIQWFTTGLRALEQRLATEADTGRYCHGDSVTIADILLMSIVAVMRVFKIAVPDIPTVDRIVALCGTHEAFAKADPFRQEGAPSV
jgi:maleylacetoacetate isomerase